MIIMLQPEQVTAFWDAIKHGVSIANRYSNADADIQQNLNKLLEQLLSGKAQCWVGMQEREGERLLHAFGITVIVDDGAYLEPYLFLHTLYAFRKMSEELVNEIVPTLETFAKASGCGMLLTFTRIERLQQMYLEQGFTDEFKLYLKRL